jgi:uncharacterized protein (TIGR00369 family)
MQLLPPTRSCFVCGTENPIGLKLALHAVAGAVETRFRFRADCCGFRDTIHGGMIGTVLDELMVWAAGDATKQFAYCAEMTVRYLRPTRAGVDVLARARLVENKRGRLFLAAAELHDAEGNVLAEATGKYLPLPGELRASVLADFVEPPPGF